MNAIVRRIVSTPVRSATDTWATIAMLLAPDPSSEARKELSRIAGLACAAIASESMRDDPLVLHADTVAVRFYCLHGEDAIMNPEYDEHTFAIVPTETPWQLSIPCDPADTRWLNRELATISDNIIFRPAGQAPSFGRAFQRPAEPVQKANGFAKVLKLGAFFRP